MGMDYDALGPRVTVQGSYMVHKLLWDRHRVTDDDGPSGCPTVKYILGSRALFTACNSSPDVRHSLGHPAVRDDDHLCLYYGVDPGTWPAWTLLLQTVLGVLGTCCGENHTLLTSTFGGLYVP